MDTNDKATFSSPGSPTWDVPQILMKLVSPLTYCGLAVIGFATLAGMILYSDMSDDHRFYGFAMCALGILVCFLGVVRLAGTIKEMVVDVDYLKTEQLSGFVQGQPMKDFVDDRICKYVSSKRIQADVESGFGEVTNTKGFGQNSRNEEIGERRRGLSDRRAGLPERRADAEGRSQTDVRKCV